MDTVRDSQFTLTRSEAKQMNVEKLIEILCKALKVNTDIKLSEKCGGFHFHHLRRSGKISERQVANLVAKVKSTAIDPNELIERLYKKLGVHNVTDLSKECGEFDFRSIENSASVSGRQMVDIIAKIKSAPRKSPIHTIAEFFPLDMSERDHRLSPKRAEDKGNLYEMDLLKELKRSKGIYIFYDSQGKAIYVGKTNRELLFEMNTTLSRKFSTNMFCVKHPQKNRRYQRDIMRKIVPKEIKLSDLAAYFSAYQVDDDMIDIIETIMIRGFANHLLNSSMGNVLSSDRYAK